MSSKILDKSSLSDKEKGSGLDLIFYKLDELETEIQVIADSWVAV